jgi:hypothetical protein
MGYIPKENGPKVNGHASEALTALQKMEDVLFKEIGSIDPKTLNMAMRDALLQIRDCRWELNQIVLICAKASMKRRQRKKEEE